MIEEVWNGDDPDAADEFVAQGVVNHAAVPEHRHGIEGAKHTGRWVRASFPDGQAFLRRPRAPVPVGRRQGGRALERPGRPGTDDLTRPYRQTTKLLAQSENAFENADAGDL